MIINSIDISKALRMKKPLFHAFHLSEIFQCDWREMAYSKHRVNCLAEWAEVMNKVEWYEQ